jgi:hypothetical protein
MSRNLILDILIPFVLTGPCAQSHPTGPLDRALLQDAIEKEFVVKAEQLENIKGGVKVF